MARRPQGQAQRGSQKWLQILVNECPGLVDRYLCDFIGLSDEESVHWLSPLDKDDYAEYRDRQFIDKLGVSLEKVPLNSFWPRFGPVWDGLAKTDRGDLILVEAKAHIPELVSDPTGAEGKSLARIQESLNKAKLCYGSRSGGDWATCFYQYANRLAHLYLLRELNDLRAYLLLLCFTNDKEMDGPTSRLEWEGAIRLMESFLGIRRHKVSDSVLHVFIDVQELESSGA